MDEIENERRKRERRQIAADRRAGPGTRGKGLE
jgi:hypothetical protein